MRVKKQKNHRRSVRFYTACFGFRHPFKVLCDGTFIHHLIANRVTPADKALSNILGGPVKLFTTRCVLAELKSLGDSYFESLKAADNLMTARCDHEKRKRADACIMDIVGENNSEHFFVATQDTDVRRKLQEIPGVPVVFGLRNALFLEPPSASQRHFVKSSEEERLHMTVWEAKMLKKRTKNMVENEDEKSLSNSEEGIGDQLLGTWSVTNTQTTSRGTSLKDKAQFKRKKAKGPNPLSCMKKKSCEDPHLVKGKEKDGESAASKRIRRRKRSGRKLTETDG